MEQATILTEIEAFLQRTGMAESTFGRETLGDWRLVSELRGHNGRRPRRLWGETESKIREFMENYIPPAGADHDAANIGAGADASAGKSENLTAQTPEARAA